MPCATRPSPLPSTSPESYSLALSSTDLCTSKCWAPGDVSTRHAISASIHSVAGSVCCTGNVDHDGQCLGQRQGTLAGPRPARRAWLFQRMGEFAEAPRRQLIAMFGALGKWFAEPDFHGCRFAKVCSDFLNPSHPINREATGHLARVAAQLANLAQRTGLASPQEPARRLALLKEGASCWRRWDARAGRPLKPRPSP